MSKFLDLTGLGYFKNKLDQVKADKDTDAVEGNLAEFDANGNPVDSGEKIGDFAKKDGWYSGLTSGLAENLIDTKGQGSEHEFTRRTSCGDDSIADDGSALFKKYLGKSIVWNQLAKDFSTDDWVLPNGGSILDGVLTLNVSEAAYPIARQRMGVSPVVGHKYLIAVDVKGSTESNFVAGIGDSNSTGRSALVWLYAGSYANWVRLSGIATLTESNDNYCRFQFRNQSATGNLQLRNFIVIDLTLMFGSGNEPSTVAEFEALYNKPYYAYCEGKIIDNKVSAYETVGFNQWDEEWESGYYDPATGLPGTSTFFVRSTNAIKAFGNTQYHFHCEGNISSGNGYIVFYDASNNITGTSVLINSSDIDFTTPLNCALVKFYTKENFVSAGICINLSWSGYRNGEYEPYWKKSLPTKLNSFKVTDGTNEITVEGLKSAGSVYDEIDLVRKKYIKRVGSVDLGDLSWTYESGFWQTNLTGLRQNFTNVGDGLLCQKYIAAPTPYWTYMTDKQIGASSNGLLHIVDSGYNNLSVFQAAMSGVMLNFELATPIEYDLVDDFLDVLTVADFGTEYAAPTEEVDANGVPKSAPFRAQIAYSTDYTREVTNLPKNYQSQDSMDAMLSALGTALGFTWSKSYDATNKKYTYTIVNNS